MFIDSHCHLHLIDYDKLNCTMHDIVQLASQNNVEHLLCVATTIEQTDELKNIADKFPNVTISVGLHPNEEVAKEPSEDELLIYQQSPKVVAIGETGLDYFRTEGGEPWQRERFRVQIRVAKACNKPLIIHSRAARKDTIEILKSEQANEVGGVLHCFTEDWDMAKKAMDLNFYISFSGIVTFKNAGDLQELAKKVPLNRILIETDSPYLAPTPKRGQINQPAYVRYVGEFLANLKGIPIDTFARETTNNYYNLFGKK